MWIFADPPWHIDAAVERLYRSFLSSPDDLRTINDLGGPELRARTSEDDLVDLVEGEPVQGPITELAGARAFVGGDGLGFRWGVAVLQIGGDPPCAEGVVAERCHDPRLASFPLHLFECVALRERPVGQRAASSDRRAEQRRAFILADPSRCHILVQSGVQIVWGSSWSLPRRTTCFGPPTEASGLTRIT